MASSPREIIAKAEWGIENPTRPWPPENGDECRWALDRADIIINAMLAGGYDLTPRGSVSLFDDDTYPGYWIALPLRDDPTEWCWGHFGQSMVMGGNGPFATLQKCCADLSARNGDRP